MLLLSILCQMVISICGPSLLFSIRHINLLSRLENPILELQECSRKWMGLWSSPLKFFFIWIIRLNSLFLLKQGPSDSQTVRDVAKKNLKDDQTTWLRPCPDYNLAQLSAFLYWKNNNNTPVDNTELTIFNSYGSISCLWKLMVWDMKCFAK